MYYILKELWLYIMLTIYCGHFEGLVFSCTLNVHIGILLIEVCANKKQARLFYKYSHVHTPETLQWPQILLLTKVFALSSPLTLLKPDSVVAATAQIIYHTNLLTTPQFCMPSYCRPIPQANVLWVTTWAYADTVPLNFWDKCLSHDAVILD